MQCPSCNQNATSFLRSVFSLQGVSVVKSAQGYLRCQHCGTLLRVTTYGTRFWIFYIPTILLLTLLIIFYRHLEPTLGIDPGIIWVCLVLVIFVTFTLGIWMNAEVEKVNVDTKAATD